MDDTPLFDAPWPDDLDPATVPFHTRSATILERKDYFGDPSLFGTLTESQVLSWWNAGPVTVADIRDTGNAAIIRHHAETARRQQMEADLAAVAEEPWARHVWYRDPRFRAFLPKCDATMFDIVMSGTVDERRDLWVDLDALRAAVDAQAALSLPEAVSGYVEAISGQHGERLDMLLARTGLGGQDPISGAEAGRRIGVTRGRVYQLTTRLGELRDQARPLAGVWMPQVADAERDGWPEGHAEAGIEATKRFFR